MIANGLLSVANHALVRSCHRSFFIPHLTTDRPLPSVPPLEYPQLWTRGGLLHTRCG